MYTSAQRYTINKTGVAFQNIYSSRDTFMPKSNKINWQINRFSEENIKKIHKMYPQRVSDSDENKLASP